MRDLVASSPNQRGFPRSDISQPCHRDELVTVAPLGKPNHPLDVAPDVVRCMVKDNELQAARGIPRHTPHYFECLSNGVHILVPQLELLDLFVVLILW